jgi:hypothetical protein
MMRRGITADTALRLARYFGNGIPPGRTTKTGTLNPCSNVFFCVTFKYERPLVPSGR